MAELPPEKNQQSQKEVSSDADDSLEKALAELASLVKSTPIEDEIDWLKFLPYLLLLWGYFRVYQIEPYVKLEDDAKPKIITLANGYKALDQGYSLTVSKGADYGSYCMGKLIEAAKELIKIMAERGATLLGFSGHEIVQRAAWMFSVTQRIAVSNFIPTPMDWDLYQQIQKLHRDAIEHIAPANEDRRPL